MQSLRTEKQRLHDFEHAALPYRNELLRAAAHFYHRDDAGDLVQEVYLRAWKSFDQFTPGTNCRAWLHKILFYVVAANRRQWYNKKQNRLELDDFESTAKDQYDVEAQLQDQQFLRTIKLLPPIFGQVVLLADIHELSYREIAEKLNIPIGTVMSRLNRGRQQLRTILTQRTH